MTRKILYSPNFGAGWVTWGGDTLEQKKFMLTYQPFIDAIEAGLPVVTTGAYGNEKGPLLDRFKRDWAEKFPGVAPPYMGGLRGLQVYEAKGPVRINEYDGAEFVEEPEDYQDWL